MGKKSEKTKEIIKTTVKIAGIVASVGGAFMTAMNGKKE